MALPFPAITPENEFFWTGGVDGVLRFQRCDACQNYIHPPQSRCPQCLSDKIVIEAVSGRATVLARTVNQHVWHPEYPPPYLLAIVGLDEAPEIRLTTRIVDCDIDDVAIGDIVTVAFHRQGPVWLPFFLPIAA